MAVLAEHPLKLFLLAVGQLIMRMNFKGGPTGATVSALDPEMMQDSPVADIWDRGPVELGYLL